MGEGLLTHDAMATGAMAAAITHTPGEILGCMVFYIDDDGDLHYGQYYKLSDDERLVNAMNLVADGLEANLMVDGRDKQ